MVLAKCLGGCPSHTCVVCAQESKKQKTDLSKVVQVSSLPEVPVPAASSPNGHTTGSPIKEKPAKKLSREERARQRELAALDRERAERRQAWQR